MARLSSVTQLRDNVPRITSAVLADAAVESRIDEADKLVEQKLSLIVDFTLVTVADGLTTPEFINLLSQYKTAELCCVSAWGAKRKVEEQSDRQYWAGMYTELLTEVQNNEIDISDVAAGTNTFQNNVREDVPPALGMGEQGGFIDEDDLEDQREDYGND
jgi:hypothetical protein